MPKQDLPDLTRPSYWSLVRKERGRFLGLVICAFLVQGAVAIAFWDPPLIAYFWLLVVATGLSLLVMTIPWFINLQEVERAKQTRTIWTTLDKRIVELRLEVRSLRRTDPAAGTVADVGQIAQRLHLIAMLTERQFGCLSDPGVTSVIRELAGISTDALSTERHAVNFAYRELFGEIDRAVRTALMPENAANAVLQDHAAECVVLGAIAYPMFKALGLADSDWQALLVEWRKMASVQG